MTTAQNKPVDDLPRDPEKNPPEKLEDLEELIRKLQAKSDSIKQQLAVVELREKQGLPVDYTRVKRSLFARSQTNKSITALQKIAKAKRQELMRQSDINFEKAFFEAAKQSLSSEQFGEVLSLAFQLSNKKAEMQ